MNTKTVKLDYPITITTGSGEDAATKQVSELTLRRPKVGDLIAAEKASNGNGTAYDAALVASIADLPMPAVRDIDAADMGRVADALKALVGNSPSGAGAGSRS